MNNTNANGSPNIALIAVLAWLVPGAGHFYIGERARGATIFIALTVTFLAGIIIGGARSTVDWQDNKAWFFGQIGLGSYTLVTGAVGNVRDAKPSYGKTLDLATIYTGVAGLLNVLALLDAVGRAAWPARDTQPEKQRRQP